LSEPSIITLEKPSLIALSQTAGDAHGPGAWRSGSPIALDRRLDQVGEELLAEYFRAPPRLHDSPAR